jgi:hypothetical protein
MTRSFLLTLPAVLLAAAAVGAAEPPPEVTSAIKAIQSVSREGTGNEAAAAGWKTLAAAGPDALIPVLTAFDAAGPTAANWLRSAVDAVAEGAKKRNLPLPADDLVAFVKDTKRSTTGRRIAFELFAGAKKDEADQLLLGMIDDPSPDIRRDAVALRWERAKAAGPDGQKAEYQKLFAAARAKDQVEGLAKALEPHGVKPNLTDHFGFVTEWHVALPFDSPNGDGFGKPFPPEAGVDLAAKYPGKGGAEVAWKYVQSSDKYGQIDLVKKFAQHKNAVAYAYAVVESEKEAAAEVRVSTANAVQVFLNGKKLYEREEYHHGAPFDQYIAMVTLKAGKNEVLLKLCQNDQKEEWAQAWSFAARVCDPTGGKLPLVQVVNRDGQPTRTPLGALGPEEKSDPKDEKKEGKK